MVARIPTPSGGRPRLVLCADGGGSKVCVVIRSEDGLEVRGTAGPCNVQSVGFEPAIQRILLATYRALSQLPQSHLPPAFILPPLEDETRSAVATPPRAVNGHPKLVIPSPLHLSASQLSTLNGTIGVSIPPSPYASRPNSPRAPPLPPINCRLFSYIWLALAGISTPADSQAFLPHVTRHLGLDASRIKITNDVNLLAAPALKLPGINYVAAVVCGTGTVGRTIKVQKPTAVSNGPSKAAIRALPLEDVGVSRGWGYVLCDEGSAFWLGRLAIRSLIRTSDRISSSPIFSTAPPPRLPLHTDLLAYFGTHDPMDLIGIVSLTGPFVEGLSVGEATAKRNAFMAGAARVVFKWAFPEDGHQLPPSPPATDDSLVEEDPVTASHNEALRLAQSSITALIDLTIDLLGDRTVVDPNSTALALGGGLWQSKGYRTLLHEGLKSQGVVFSETLLVSDAAGAGAQGLASVEFGI